ncbi:MAG TPA: response regulator [Herpetosiphonaceae bacterium]
MSSTALILIVDDEQSILNLLQEILESEGFTILRATNGRDALTAALETPPDLIVTDLMMPIMDGRTLAQQLRQHPQTADTPILLISAAYTRRDADRFTAVLHKPFDVAGLVATIERLLV